MSQTEHTPLPWKVVTLGPHIIGIGHELKSGTYEMACNPVVADRDRERTEANATLIVQAVNSHAALTAACEAAKGELFQLGQESMLAFERGNRGEQMRCEKRAEEIIDQLRTALGRE